MLPPQFYIVQWYILLIGRLFVASNFGRFSQNTNLVTHICCSVVYTNAINITEHRTIPHTLRRLVAQYKVQLHTHYIAVNASRGKCRYASKVRDLPMGWCEDKHICIWFKIILECNMALGMNMGHLWHKCRGIILERIWNDFMMTVSIYTPLLLWTSL